MKRQAPVGTSGSRTTRESSNQRVDHIHWRTTECRPVKRQHARLIRELRARRLGLELRESPQPVLLCLTRSMEDRWRILGLMEGDLLGAPRELLEHSRPPTVAAVLVNHLQGRDAVLVLYENRPRVHSEQLTNYSRRRLCADGTVQRQHAEHVWGLCA
eukprot:7382366-Prymnesium_polylepis.2